jgi:hypothetical protein
MTRTTPWLRSDRFLSCRTTTGSADGPTGTDIKRPVGVVFYQGFPPGYAAPLSPAPRFQLVRLAREVC